MERPALCKPGTAFIGLNLGDTCSTLFISEQDGELIRGTRVPTLDPAFRRSVSSLPRGHGGRHSLPRPEPLELRSRALPPQASPDLR